MHKSIELGRAVLSTATSDLELWLKTLITISPQQECTNFEQHNASSLLELLSSGEVWVGRGNGMYIELDLYLRGQPPANEQLRQLSEVILGATVWDQLRLLPTLPDDTFQAPGKLRILINHSSQQAIAVAKKRHRILSNGTAADLRPPEGVPAFFLNSVIFSMELLETVQRRRATTVKRLKTSTSGQSISLPNIQAIDDRKQEALDELLLEAEGKLELPLPPIPKNKYHLPSSPTNITSSASISSIDVSQKRLLSSGIPNLTEDMEDAKTNFEMADLKVLVDGALRISVSNNINNRTLPGIKTKANTFGPGLADIAPIIWKSGYSLSLSQRANLLPVLNRSLCQLATAGKVTSISLSKKLSALTTPLAPFPSSNQPLDQNLTGVSDGRLTNISAAPRLWLQLQKHTPCKSTTPLSSFMATEVSSTTRSHSEDMLDQSWQEHATNSRSRLFAVDPGGSGVSGTDHIINDNPATLAPCNDISSEQLVPGALAPQHMLGDIDDELLLGDERFQPPGLHNAVQLRNPVKPSRSSPKDYH